MRGFVAAAWHAHHDLQPSPGPDALCGHVAPRLFRRPPALRARGTAGLPPFTRPPLCSSSKERLTCADPTQNLQNTPYLSKAVGSNWAHSYFRQEVYVDGAHLFTAL
eukprot:2550492-Rhodomonas_salina.1